MRDRLIELLLNSDPLHERDLDDDLMDGEIEAIADHLLANGVILPLSKVGDEVWFINCLDEIVYIGKIHDVRYNGCSCIYRIFRSIENGGVFAFSDYEIGKSVFFARKEAEQALKGEHHAEIH